MYILRERRANVHDTNETDTSKKKQQDDARDSSTNRKDSLHLDFFP